MGPKMYLGLTTNAMISLRIPRISGLMIWFLWFINLLYNGLNEVKNAVHNVLYTAPIREIFNIIVLVSYHLIVTMIDNDPLPMITIILLLGGNSPYQALKYQYISIGLGY